MEQRISVNGTATPFIASNSSLGSRVWTSDRRGDKGRYLVSYAAIRIDNTLHISALYLVKMAH